MASKRLLSAAVRPLAAPSTTFVRPAVSQIRRISAYGYEQARALVFKEYGEPENVLSLHTHSISPAYGNVLTLRFLASPINPADINQIQGVYPSKPTFTTTMSTPNPIAVGGNEGVAEVISAGSGVKGIGKGDWVIMKQPGFGTWRTHAQTDPHNLVKIDNKEGLTPIQVGTVSINPCTAYRMLTGFANMKEGDWFVQNGANSGVGRAAIQLGKLWGYKSINVVRDRPDQTQTDKLKAELKELGADVVVTEAELLERGFRERVMEWTNGGRERLPLALNCVGGKSATALAKLLSDSGHLVTYGAMSKQPVPLPTGLLIFKDIHFEGFWVSKWGKDSPEEKKKAVDHVLDLIREGKFKDTPVDEIKWEWETKQDTLVKAVQGTLEGFRSGKSVFVFGRPGPMDQGL